MGTARELLLDANRQHKIWTICAYRCESPRGTLLRAQPSKKGNKEGRGGGRRRPRRRRRRRRRCRRRRRRRYGHSRAVRLFTRLGLTSNRSATVWRSCDTKRGGPKQCVLASAYLMQAFVRIGSNGHVRPPRELQGALPLHRGAPTELQVTTSPAPRELYPDMVDLPRSSNIRC